MRGFTLFLLAAGTVLDLDQDTRPVAKVLKLLKDMQGQLMGEKKADEEQYEKLSCWCEVNRKGKTSATDIAQARIADLEHRIKALSSKASGLEQSIAELDEELTANKEALASATALREKQAGEFHEDERDLLTSTESLKNAITVLEKHHSFLQVDKSSTTFVATVASLRASIRKIVDNNDDLLNQILNPSDKAALDGFVQSSNPSYSSQSTEIFGVLKQMEENFAKNLAESRSDEATAKSEFAELKEAKDSEIATGTQQLKMKGASLAKTREELADAKEDHKDTSAAFSADTAFLVDLEKRCAVADADYEARSKTRAQEIAAVSEAIGILADDDAHDTFGRTLGFAQLSRRAALEDGARRAASTILSRQAAKTGSRALARLAVSAKLDAFTKVQEAIDGMVTSLKTEMDDEVKHKDFCNTEFQKNDQEAYATQNEIADLSTDIATFETAIETLANDIATIKAEIKDSEVEMQEANEDRVSANREFQQTVADQRATQVILKKALDRLKKFYSFAQVHHAKRQEPGAAAPPMPEGFGEYKSNAGAGSVLTMIGNILTDAQNMEKEAIAAEQDAQAAYESLVKETAGSIKANQQALASKAEEKARTEASLVAGQADRQDAMDRGDGLAKYKGQLHTSCDFVMQNFDNRQKARGEEIESLQAAKAALRTA